MSTKKDASDYLVSVVDRFTKFSNFHKVPLGKLVERVADSIENETGESLGEIAYMMSLEDHSECLDTPLEDQDHQGINSKK